ncbi:hypothetical protein ABIA33_007694, partial [Streptacidiphilus sp. MAP12-16]|uniref:hypothetical protein n=1 Tax=Streptacidiphilus sp. MAP12-16 TaxID=3156300 RepID=UPI003515935B
MNSEGTQNPTTNTPGFPEGETKTANKESRRDSTQATNEFPEGELCGAGNSERNSLRPFMAPP